MLHFQLSDILVCDKMMRCEARRVNQRVLVVISLIAVFSPFSKPAAPPSQNSGYYTTYCIYEFLFSLCVCVSDESELKCGFHVVQKRHTCTPEMKRTRLKK